MSAFSLAVASKTYLGMDQVVLGDGRTVPLLPVYKSDARSPRFRIEAPRRRGRNRWMRVDDAISFGQEDLPGAMYRSMADVYGTEPASAPEEHWNPPELPGTQNPTELVASLIRTLTVGASRNPSETSTVHRWYRGPGIRMRRSAELWVSVKTSEITAYLTISDASNLLRHGQVRPMQEVRTVTIPAAKTLPVMMDSLAERLVDTFPTATLRVRGVALTRMGTVPEIFDAVQLARFLEPMSEARYYLIDKGFQISDVRLGPDTCTFQLSRRVENSGSPHHGITLDLARGTLAATCRHVSDYEAARLVAELTDTLPAFDSATESHTRSLI